MQKIMFNDHYGRTQAVLEGRMTMFRKIVPNQTRINLEDLSEYQLYDRLNEEYYQKLAIERYSRYEKGEVVAVAQSYRSIYGDVAIMAPEMSITGMDNKMLVKADLMPHRIKILDIKVERLQDISDKDCLREGIFPDGEVCTTRGDLTFFNFKGNLENSFYSPRQAFASLIDKVSGKGTWERNPWTFAYSFQMV